MWELRWWPRRRLLSLVWWICFSHFPADSFCVCVCVCACVCVFLAATVVDFVLCDVAKIRRRRRGLARLCDAERAAGFLPICCGRCFGAFLFARNINALQVSGQSVKVASSLFIQWKRRKGTNALRRFAGSAAQCYARHLSIQQRDQRKIVWSPFQNRIHRGNYHDSIVYLCRAEKKGRLAPNHFDRNAEKTKLPKMCRENKTKPTCRCF